MTTAGSVNYVNPTLDQTVRIFDEFYKYDLVVNSNDYDIVYSYLKTVFTDNTLAVKNFTASVFQAAHDANIPVLEFLQQLQGQDALTLTATLAYYLNGTRSNATLLGVSTAIAPNYYAARNVRT